MHKIPIYLLAGGKSERFGSDKARALVGGRPLILRLAEEFESAATSITAVARRTGEFDDLGLRTICDVAPGNGPMGGLHAALADLADGEWLLLVACDWIGAKAGWISILLQHAGGGGECVYFRDDRPQPLLALYRKSALVEVERSLRENRLAMHGLIERLNSVAVAPPEDWQVARNVNYRSQLPGE